MKSFETVLFDLDGTLIRIPPNFVSLLNPLLRETCALLHVKEPSDNEIRNLWRSGKNYQHILKEWGIKPSDFLVFWEIFDQKDFELRKKLIQDQEIRLFDDTIPILTQIRQKKSVKTGLISNTPEIIADYELKTFNLESFFDCRIFLGSINQSHAKPEPDGLLWCLEGLENEIKNKNATCYVGDSEIDIIASKKANISTVLIIRDHNIDMKLTYTPDIYLNSLADILKYI